MVGLADLKRYTDNLKMCQMTVNNKYCYFQLSGLTTYEFLDILNYKSWIYKTYQKNVTVRYVNIIKKLERGYAILRTSVGFGPLLLRFLRSLRFQIRDQDIEAYRARNVVFPDLKINLYDFQDRMINDWWNVGGIGVVKSPTGSGKCCKGNTLILTDRGLIKIEDIIRGISDSKNRDIGQYNLYDNLYGEKFIDNDNIKNLNNVVSISSQLKYGTYNISGKYDMGVNDIITTTTSMGFEIGGTPEHKIIVIDNNGDIIFKKLGDITNEDNIAISLCTNIFNDRLKLNYHYRLSSKNIKNILEDIEYMNEDIATLLGYIVAEGSEERNIGHMTMANYDEEIVSNTIRICQNLGTNARRDEYNDKLTGVTISSVGLVDFIYYLGYRHGAKNKEIPWSILQADRKSQIAFIRALFDCDGTVYRAINIDTEKEKSKELVEYYSSSFELCRQLQIMLLNFGIIGRLSNKEIRECEESYRLSITGGEILKFTNIIGFGIKRKNDILDRCVIILENRDRWTDIVYPNIDKKLKILYERLKLFRGQIVKLLSEGFIFDKVEDIKKEKDNVYDVTIDNIHSYIGNGMVNHNTIVGCRAIKQVGRKALILVHTSDLLINVWNESLIKMFGPGIMSQVGIIGGGLTDSDRMAMKIGVRTGDFEENVKKDIVIATFQTLNNRIEELSQYKFGLMIVDECIPIDSDIWTNDGVVRYEDLGYGQEYKKDIFQVWSRDNKDNIINNGYKKIKTRMKHMYRTSVETGDELICSLDHRVLTRKDDGKEEFVEIEKAKNIARSLIKPYDMRKECILARIFGYLLGDGNITYHKNSRYMYYGGTATGDYKGLLKLKYDMRRLGYDSANIRENFSDSEITSGKKFLVGYSFSFANDLASKLVDLGYSAGEKTDVIYDIPDWIINGSKDVKREFLAGYMGADGTTPYFDDKDEERKRSFNAPLFSINKRQDLIEKSMKFVGQLNQLFKEFNIDFTRVNIYDGNIRKDNTITKTIMIVLTGDRESLKNFLDIGFRYCTEREKLGETILLYFKYIDECNKELKELQNISIDVHNRIKKAPSKIINMINDIRSPSQSDIVSSDMEIKDIIKRKNLIKLTASSLSHLLYDDQMVVSPEDILGFKKWREKIKGDFIFLDILKYEYRGYEQGYTLTVNKDHNYLVNGFNVKNCHHVPAAMFRKVNAAIRAPYKMGLSATVRRLDGLEKDVYGSLGDIQTSVSIRELINKGILAEPRFQSPIIVDKAIIDEIDSCGYGGLNLSRFVKKKSASSEKKKNYIVNICKNIAARDRKFLLFTDYVSAEDVYVRDMYADALLKESVRVSVIDQGMSTEERSAVFGFLESGDISGIVFGRLGSEGVNIPSVDVVVMANGIKSPITYTQRVGRAMRRIPGKDWCDVFEILIDTKMELRWSEYNFAEYREEGFQKLVYRVE